MGDAVKGQKDGTLRERLVYAAAQFVRDGMAGGAFVGIMTIALSALRDADLIGPAAVPTADPNAVVAGGGILVTALAIWRVVRPYGYQLVRAIVALRPSGGGEPVVDMTAAVQEYFQSSEFHRAVATAVLAVLDRDEAVRSDRAVNAPQPVPEAQVGDTIVLSASPLPGGTE